MKEIIIARNTILGASVSILFTRVETANKKLYSVFDNVENKSFVLSKY